MEPLGSSTGRAEEEVTLVVRARGRRSQPFLQTVLSGEYRDLNNYNKVPLNGS